MHLHYTKMLNDMDARLWLMQHRTELFEPLDTILLKEHGSWSNSYLLDIGCQNITAWISAADGLWRHSLNRSSLIDPHNICRIRIRWAGLCMTTVDIAHDWNIQIERQFKWEGHTWYHTEQKLFNQIFSWLATCPSYRRIMAQKHTAAIKEELVAEALHPRRIEQWLDHGVELEAM
jgi:hypothetical protein